MTRNPYNAMTLEDNDTVTISIPRIVAEKFVSGDGEWRDGGVVVAAMHKALEDQ
jgi:hypothetical protein